MARISRNSQASGSYGTKNVERFDPGAQLQTQLNGCDMVSWLCCQEPKRELTQQRKLFDSGTVGVLNVLLRLEEKTTGGMTVWSFFRNGRRAPVRESLGAKLGAAWITATISGPRYGSTSGLQRAANATRFRARRTIHLARHIIPLTEEENAHTSPGSPD
jgi:hypothetical protein